VRRYLEKSLIFPELAAACSAKEVSLLVIVSFSKRYSDRKLFGGILDAARIERVVRLVQLKFIHPHRPRRTIRRRGYKDHGSKRPETEWSESFDWSFTEQQNELEERELEYFDQVEFFVRRTADWLLKNFSKECKV